MIDYKNFLKTVHTFRDYCLGKYKDEIDLLPAKDRESRLGVLEGNRDFRSALMTSIDPTYKDPIDYVARLTKTPRLLKMVLRRILSAWEHIHGEVDFDDLFVATVMRFSAPQAYDFILENVGELRALASGQYGDGIKKESLKKSREHIKTKWFRVMEDVAWDVEAAERLVAFLFPAWDEKQFHSAYVPQGISNYYPTDYWQRVNIEFISETEIQDQEILKALRAWKSNHNDLVIGNMLLPDALYSIPDLLPIFEQFARYFLEAMDIRELAEVLFGIILKSEGVKANVDSCPAFVSLWRLSTRIPLEQEEKHREWVIKQIVFALPLSLRFANDLYNYWKHNHYTGRQTKTPELRKLVISNFKELFKDRPEAFIASLDTNFIYSVFNFAVSYSRPDNGGNGFEPGEWRWLANLLMDAAKLKPQIVLPHIVPFIIDSPYTISFSRTFIFNNEMAVALFDDRLPELMTLLANTSFEKNLKEDILEQLSFGRNAAIDWLKKDETGCH